MKKLGLKICALVGVAVFFNACSSIPSCDDSDVTSNLTQIILQNEYSRLSPADQKKLNFDYSGFMTEMTDEKSKTQYCKANVKIYGNAGGKNVKNDLWLEYTAKYTDDGMIYTEARW